jgi:hypothetical protein
MISNYPESPGYKVEGPSKESAEQMDVQSAVIRALAFTVLQSGDYTADEVAEIIQRDILAVRPRCSELKRKNLIADSGLRRRNASGHKATVWTIKPQQNN